ncbi:acyl-CoA-binding domain-containing protein 4 isoform X1 [Lagenorhynchus albirostris]|uniref:acyl-CoA-binding domain-containing protein 4 isoform X1 n=2 Tax=Lagenorhynchus albirostris TaxID=27610 RepID=UPI0028F0021B|nr:acyl-CoA-binding domain-containing protein 4 isoform X1 [Lagenorhynchus albirostris]
MGTENENPEPDCQKQFQAAVSVIQNLPKNGSYRPSYKEMLRFYSYYKQATMGPCLVPQPGFWDPIGRYKWDAWNSLGKMSREQAMSAYVTEMKLVAQRVIDTVPLGEVAEDMFGYFEPLYQVIPDMPRPPETFLKRVTGWKEQVLNGDAEPTPEPPCLPKEPAPPSPESQPPRDQDSEVFCDSMEQLEPELQVGAEQRGALGGELNTRNSTESPAKKGRLESTLLGPQELDTWLVGTVRALQESMRDVQGRLQSLESMPVPRKQVSPVRRPRARLGQHFEGLFSGLLIQPLLSLSPRLCLLTPLPSPENVVARGAGKEVRGSVVMLPAWNWERASFPALISLCLKSN